MQTAMLSSARTTPERSCPARSSTPDLLGRRAGARTAVGLRAAWEVPVQPVSGSPSASRDDLDDAGLVELVTKSDPDALAVLYQRHGAVCYRLARRITANDVLAEDAVQETFVGLWRDPAAYRRDQGSVRSWLLGLTHHNAVDLVRRA